MACLVVISGPATGRYFPLEQHHVVAIGRDEECTFQIVDPLISRQHLQVRMGDDGRHFAADYRSANGVIVNGKKITADAPLTNGDEICIGATKLVYSSADYPNADSAMTQWHQQKGEWKRGTIVQK